MKKQTIQKRTAQSAIVIAAITALWGCGGSGDKPAATPTAPSFNTSAPAATNQSFQVVSFGDSLSDVGTYQPGVAIALQSLGVDPTVATGRFTTNPGSIWTQDVATYFGNGGLTPAVQGGFNVPPQTLAGFGYAQGGARVSQQPGTDYAADNSGALTYPVSVQLSNYITAHATFKNTQLVLVNGGANDILFELGKLAAPTNAETADVAAANVKKAADDLVTVVSGIVGAGAVHVVVANVPDIGQTPFGAVEQTANAPVISSLVAAFNGELASQLQSQNLMSKVVYIDLATALNDIIKAPQQYGFSHANKDMACDATKLVQFGESSLFCTPAAYSAPDADKTYMFADDIHPTTALHQLLANIVENAVNASLASK